MDMHLQFGHGMMEHSRTLVTSWGGGTVILSPRDLEDGQLVSMGTDIRALPNGQVLVDPQLYLPHADHARLCSHPYWPKSYSTGTFWTGADLDTMLNDLFNLNRRIGCSQVILPGTLAATVDDDWLGIQSAILDRAQQIGGMGRLIATVALSADAVKDLNQVHKLLDAAEDWPDSDVYVVCEHPRGEYLSTEPVWLANVLDLTATFRLQGRKVILGYCSHQMLVAGCSAANAIASGTWLNVRSFPPEKFQVVVSEPIRRTIWCYCPQALSEFKMPFMDTAFFQGVLPLMAPRGGMDSSSVTNLFSGGQPTSVGLAEQDAFRHYLKNLRLQALDAHRGSFASTLGAHEQLLDDAESVLDQLHAVGVLGRPRDFYDILDVNRSAMAQLRTRLGPLLTREWANL